MSGGEKKKIVGRKNLVMTCVNERVRVRGVNSGPLTTKKNKNY